MNTCVTSAPGKLVIAGEYAVLEGYPGIVSAVQKRAVVTGFPSTAWQMGSKIYGLVDLPHPAAEFELVNAVFQIAQEQNVLGPPKNLHIDSSALYQKIQNKNYKLGLGSSAAVTTSLAAQCLDDSHANPNAIFSLAFAAHQIFSNHAGSGIDIAASCYGGLLRFERISDQSLPQVTPLSLKIDSQSLIAVFTGKSQDTRIFLKAVAEVKKNKPREHHALMKDLGEIAIMLQEPLCNKSDWPLLTSLVNKNLALLQTLGEKAHINLVTDEHRHLAQLARQHQGASKPSGAGGGDIAICFIPVEQKNLFLESLKNSNLQYLPLDFLDSGVQIQNTL